MHYLIPKIFEAKNRNFWSGRRDLNTSLTSYSLYHTTILNKTLLKLY